MSTSFVPDPNVAEAIARGNRVVFVSFKMVVQLGFLINNDVS
jgi:hypothetical protein